MATKSASTLAVFFVLFLVIFEVPEIEAQDDECLKEYGGDVGFEFCAPRIFPTFCYRNCQEDKGAQGGKCVWGEDSVICLCDFCSDQVNDHQEDKWIWIDLAGDQTVDQENRIVYSFLAGDLG